MICIQNNISEVYRLLKVIKRVDAVDQFHSSFHWKILNVYFFFHFFVKLFRLHLWISLPELKGKSVWLNPQLYESIKTLVICMWQRNRLAVYAHTHTHTCTHTHKALEFEFNLVSLKVTLCHYINYWAIILMISKQKIWFNTSSCFILCKYKNYWVDSTDYFSLSLYFRH